MFSGGRSSILQAQVTQALGSYFDAFKIDGFEWARYIMRLCIYS